MRLIKKWYFKIYHLLKFLGIFILIFGIKKNVYAISEIPYQENFIVSEESCSNNMMNPEFIKGARFNDGSNKYGANNMNYASQLIPVQGGQYYFIKINANFSSASVWGFNDESSNAVLLGNIARNGSQFYTFNSHKYIGVMMGSYSWGDISQATIMMNQGQTGEEYVAFKLCEPEPENNVYSGFLGLYTNRLTYLAEGFTSNPYLIAMIGIIFAWIVLELFLRILNIRGGRR